jgi:hypothetical protein
MMLRTTPPVPLNTLNKNVVDTVDHPDEPVADFNPALIDVTAVDHVS